MADFPVPLDNLIAYVKTLHPGGGPLENVSDAFTVSTQLDEQADALIGYFVDQARRSGASWSQIGGAMGVSKQAAQKRFVPRTGADLVAAAGWAGSPSAAFSRFTARAARALAAAGTLAAPDPVSSAHIMAALLTEPEGLAAKAVATVGLSPEQVYSAVGAGPAAQAARVDPQTLLALAFDESANDTLKGTLQSALHLGHNYIGTEHLLLGVLAAGGPASDALAGLGLTPQRAEELIAAETAALRAPKTGE